MEQTTLVDRDSVIETFKSSELGQSFAEISDESLNVAWAAFIGALSEAERARLRNELGPRWEEHSDIASLANGIAELITVWGGTYDLYIELSSICAALGSSELAQSFLDKADIEKGKSLTLDTPTAPVASAPVAPVAPATEEQGNAAPQNSQVPTNAAPVVQQEAPVEGSVIQATREQLPDIGKDGFLESNFNAWDSWYNTDGAEQTHYGDTVTYRLAADFLDGLDFEDWGCGYAWMRQFAKNGRYTGVDGTWTKWCDRQADLAKYRSRTPGLHMRHVIEHNLHWEPVLENAIESFQKRMVLTLFTPLVDETRIIDRPALSVPDTAFKLEDITSRFVDCTWKMEAYNTGTAYGVETIFYLEKN